MFLYIYLSTHRARLILTGSGQHTTDFNIQDYLFHSGKEMRLKIHKAALSVSPSGVRLAHQASAAPFSSYSVLSLCNSHWASPLTPSKCVSYSTILCVIKRQKALVCRDGEVCSCRDISVTKNFEGFVVSVKDPSVPHSNSPSNVRLPSFKHVCSCGCWP